MKKNTDRWGKTKSNFDSKWQAKYERKTDSSAFQDLGIKKRKPLKAPKYTNSKEFLREISSDESDVERKPFDLYGMNK